MYLWVHLGAEEGEQTDDVSLSQLVFLSTGHAQRLVLQHGPLYHHGRREPQRLAQSAICGNENGQQARVDEVRVG